MHDDYVLEDRMKARKAQQAFTLLVICWGSFIYADSQKIKTRARQRIKLSHGTTS